jgi:hypothetical protein
MPFFLLVGTFPKFSHNSFEKGERAAYCFSKEFCANPRCISMKRKRGRNISNW